MPVALADERAVPATSDGACEPLPEAQVSDGARRAFQALAAYAFDEAVCWPSKKTIARDLGVSPRTVDRYVAELERAGWLWIHKRREWTDATGRVRRAKFDFNVYELLAPFAVSEPTTRKVIRRAHRKAVIAARARVARGSCRTNTEGEPAGRSWCGCKACLPDRPTLARKPHTPVRDAIRDREELFDRALTPDEQRLVARRVHGGARGWVT